MHRADFFVYFKRLEPEAYALLSALQQGAALSQALERSVDYSSSSIEEVTGELEAWFANWSSLGWFCKPESQSA